MSRVYGPDYMLELCRLSVQPGWRHFLYGGKPGVVERLRKRLAEMLPGIQIAGTFTPPFGPLSFTQQDSLIQTVRQARVDVLWVGISTPRQERFMADFIDKVDAKLLVGVGAAFDIHAGLLRDAPQWMKVSGLQWLHRLLQDPKRLAERYLRNNPEFLCRLALQFLRIQRPVVPVGDTMNR